MGRLILLSSIVQVYSIKGRGNARKELGEFKEAIADYNQAIKLDPNDAKVYHNRGLVYGIFC